MVDVKRVVVGSLLAGLFLFTSGCVVEPHEGFYDHDHHRYYHEHNWHACGEHEDHYCH